MTKPTNKPIPSNDVIDFKFNAEKIDEVVNSNIEKYVDRFGIERYTLEGIRKNLSPLGNTYTQEQAEAAITSGEIIDGAFFFIWSGNERSIADMYQNIGGVITATGKSITSDEFVSYVNSLELINDASAKTINYGRDDGGVNVEPGIYRLSTGNPEPSTQKEVRTLDFIFLKAGDRITVPYYFNVAGVFYDNASPNAYNGKYFEYKYDYYATEDCYSRLIFKYVGSDPSYDPTQSSVFDLITIVRNSTVRLSNIPEGGIASYMINLSSYQTDYPIEPGSIRSGDGMNNPPTDTFVQRTGMFSVSVGDTFTITDSAYLLCPFYYDANGVFISSPGVWYSGSVSSPVSGRVRFTTKRSDNGESINKIPFASWIRGPSTASKMPPNIDMVAEGGIPFAKINTETDRTGFPIVEGSINSTTGVNSGPTSTFVHRTDMIAIGVGDSFTLTDSTYLYCPFYYDANGVFISSDGAWHSNVITSTINGRVRFTTKRADNGNDINTKTQMDWVSVRAALIKKTAQIGPDVVQESSLTPALRAKINVGGSGQWAGKKWYTLGDSITERGWYQPLVEDITGIGSFTNYGVGGTTIAKLNSADTTAMSVRWNTMNSDPDVITVWGGVNDFGYSYGSNGGTDLGVFSDTSPLTFYGALRTIIEGLTIKYPGVKIAFIVTTPVANSMGMRSPNAKGFYLADYCKAVREVCNDYSVPYLDLQLNSGFNEKNVNIMTSNFAGTAPDGLHPSHLGMSWISTKLAAFLNGI
ncbi:SGNH/GDSL hydrolase family protein [uncultured Serratia sp.]|uniref:SGNH/GDSL hydrolase family protein n=1 Tax=uncultured Serratia sp. TaxID=239175 RepID=UPI0025835055|nr:SGNH/GDSL hydrolase family protein [uncultured Serratia sp.]